MKFLSKIFSPVFLFISIFLLLYTFYKSEFYWNGGIREYYYKYYLISFMLIIVSIVMLATASIIIYKLINRNAPQGSNGNKEIVANYKGGVVTLKQAQMELSKLIMKNPKLKDITFHGLNANQKEMVIKEIVLKEIAYKEAKKQRLNKIMIPIAY